MPDRVKASPNAKCVREAHVHSIADKGKHIDNIALARTVGADEDGHGSQRNVLLPSYTFVVRDSDSRDFRTLFVHVQLSFSKAFRVSNIFRKRSRVDSSNSFSSELI